MRYKLFLCSIGNSIVHANCVSSTFIRRIQRTKQKLHVYCAKKHSITLSAISWQHTNRNAREKCIRAVSRDRKQLDYHQLWTRLVHRLKELQMTNDQPAIIHSAQHRPSIWTSCSLISLNFCWPAIRPTAWSVACARTFSSWTRWNGCSIGMHRRKQKQLHLNIALMTFL